MRITKLVFISISLVIVSVNVAHAKDYKVTIPDKYVPYLEKVSPNIEKYMSDTFTAEAKQVIDSEYTQAKEKMTEDEKIDAIKVK